MPAAPAAEDGDPPDPAPETGLEEKYTVAQAIDHIGFGRYQVALLVYAGCVWAADAMEMMLLSFLGPAVTCEWGLSPRQEGTISTVVFLGAMAGAYCWGLLSDSKGRRLGFGATALFTFIFGILSALAPNFAWLLVFRAAVGVGLGGAHVAFTLAMEVTPTKCRVPVLVCVQGFWTLGTMFEAGLAWGILSSWGWRWLLGLSSLPLLALLLTYPFIPESPYYLAVSGQQAKAQAVLQHVAQYNKASMPVGVLSQHVAKTSAASAPKLAYGGKAPQWLVTASQTTLSGLSEIALGFRRLMGKTLRRTSLLLMVIWFGNALTYYGLVLLTTTLHASSSEASCVAGQRLQLSSAALGQIFITTTAELPGLLVAAALADVIGRKWCISLGLTCIAGFMMALLWFPLSVGLLFGGRAASMGAYTVLFIYTPEVFPTKVRSFGLGLNNSLSRFGAILAPYLAVELARSGHADIAEIIIAAMCLLAAVCASALPLETSGRALEVEGAGVEITNKGSQSRAKGSEEEELSPDQSSSVPSRERSPRGERENANLLQGAVQSHNSGAW
ncbi:hypothetical protein WJX73_003774 [Symbiochloris irregularis]|uniref:Major facilitator superfamily (MFS) profile domain-containing protein n=1 Tax=Symbiochloris irregularis TaxID=706552 RepID=A0AAW1NL04_9CHLO